MVEPVLERGELEIWSGSGEATKCGKLLSSMEVPMPITLEAVDAEVMKLSLEDQTRLLERLLARVEPEVDPEIERAAIQEAKRRAAAIDAGAVALLPGPETLAQIVAELL